MNPDWPIEDIPDPDRLFMRAHHMFFHDGRLEPGVFRDHESSMSTDWENYSTPEETRQRGNIPADNAVISFHSGNARRIDLEVRHEPLADNRAHAGVYGEKSPEVRMHLLPTTHVELALPAE